MFNKVVAREIDYVTEDEAYEHLAKSIIIQAIEDYRNILNGKSIDRHVNLYKDKKEVERFFLSQWFALLSEWDGETLMKLLQEQEGKQK